MGFWCVRQLAKVKLPLCRWSPRLIPAGLVLASWVAGPLAAAPAEDGSPASVGGERSPALIQLFLANQSQLEVMSLHIAPLGQETWSENLLGDRPLSPKTERVMELSPNVNVGCVYRLRAILADGETVEQPGLDLCHSQELRLDERIGGF